PTTGSSSRERVAIRAPSPRNNSRCPMVSPDGLSPSPPPTPRHRQGPFLLLAALALAAAAGFMLWSDYQARRERDEGLRAAHLGQFSGAERLLRRALAREPDNVDLIRALALGFLGAGDLAEAEPHVDHWCELRPDDAEPFRYRMDLRHRKARAAPT